MIPKKVRDFLARFEPKWYGWRFKATLVAVVSAAFAVPLVLLAIPYLDMFNDMAVQPKGRPQNLYGRLFGKSLIVERPPVEGTVPVDYYPYPFPGKDEKTALAAAAALTNPLRPTAEVLATGQKLFNYYCWTCHGKQAEGNGPIVGPGRVPAPPSLHTDAARAFPDGRIFHIITEGQNVMPSYADKFTPEERWAIIYYVRALQRAMNPKPEDLK
jgi:mono/diheme cytochrome c family protein